MNKEVKCTTILSWAYICLQIFLKRPIAFFMSSAIKSECAGTLDKCAIFSLWALEGAKKRRHFQYERLFNNNGFDHAIVNSNFEEETLFCICLTFFIALHLILLLYILLSKFIEALLFLRKCNIKLLFSVLRFWAKVSAAAGMSTYLKNCSVLVLVFFTIFKCI